VRPLTGALGERLTLGAGFDGIGTGLGGYPLGVSFGVDERSAARRFGLDIEQGSVAASYDV
jgi:hypothetical protein